MFSDAFLFPYFSVKILCETTYCYIECADLQLSIFALLLRIEALPAVDVVIVECSDYDCSYMTLSVAAPTADVFVHCTGYASCLDLSIYSLDGAEDFNIACEGQYSCAGSTMFVQNASSVNLTCSAQYACSQFSVSLLSVQQAYIQCAGPESCWTANFVFDAESVLFEATQYRAAYFANIDGTLISTKYVDTHVYAADYRMCMCVA